MRALPAESLEYLELTALGNTALPTATGAAVGAGAGAGAGAVVGAAASEPHCALRKSFHFMPLREPASLAALYLALHSVIVSACAEEPCSATVARTAAATSSVKRRVMITYLLGCMN